MADLLLDVDLPKGVWSRSGRPRRGDVVRWFGALTLILAGLAVPLVAVKLGMVVAGLVGFFAVPAVVSNRLEKIESELARADRREVPALLSGLEQRRVVALFAPHGWVELQKARLHLKTGDGRAAAHALGECGRMCKDQEHPAILSGQARAFALSGDRNDARDKLMALKKRDEMRPRDHLDLGVVLLGESGRAAKAKEEIERAAEQLGDHPQVIAARAVVAARDDELDEAQALLASCEGRDGIEDDPIAQELIKKARKALRPKLQASAKAAKKSKKSKATSAASPASGSQRSTAAGKKKGRGKKKDKRRERREKRRAAKSTPAAPVAAAVEAKTVAGDAATDSSNEAAAAAASEAAAKEAAAKEAAAKEAAAKEAAAKEAAAKEAAAKEAAAKDAAAKDAAAKEAAAKEAAAKEAAAKETAAKEAAARDAEQETGSAPGGGTSVEEWPSTERAEPLAADSGRLPSRAPTLLPEESGSRPAASSTRPSDRQTIPPPPRLDLSPKTPAATSKLDLAVKSPSQTPTLDLTPKTPSKTPTLGLAESAGDESPEDKSAEDESPGDGAETPDTPSRRTTLPPGEPQSDDDAATPKPPPGKPGSLFNAIGSRTSFFKPPPLPGGPSDATAAKVAPPPVVGAPPKTGAPSPGSPDAEGWDDLLGEDSGPSPIAPKPPQKPD